MSKLSPTLFALSLALALAAMPAIAQQVTTSKGLRTLPRTDAMKTEAELRQALVSAEQILAEVLADFEAAERAHATVSADAAGFSTTVKGPNADYERAKAAFDLTDRQYRDDLAAFGQRQAALATDIQNQRAAAAPLEALPSAQRDIKEVFRINEWSQRIDKERQAVKAENERLLAEYNRVEAERVRLQKQLEADKAALDKRRQALVGNAGSVTESGKLAHAQLRTALAYVESVREQLNGITANKMERSELYKRAEAKLR